MSALPEKGHWYILPRSKFRSVLTYVQMQTLAVLPENRNIFLSEIRIIRFCTNISITSDSNAASYFTLF